MLILFLVLSASVFGPSHCFVPNALHAISVPRQDINQSIEGNWVTTKLDESATNTNDGGASLPRETGAIDRIGLLKSNITPYNQITESVPTSDTMLVRSQTDPHLTVRVANSDDDEQIASLRVGAFSNFNPDMRENICERSRILISRRRELGSCCIIAENKKISTVYGSAEISHHEFLRTQLGRFRLRYSLLYITELVVNKIYRRRGAANLMMEAIDIIGKGRNIETVYLHVDTTNYSAVCLYKKAGYRILPKDNHIYIQFSSKLNLYDGAANGKKHHLMAKDLVQSTTWNSEFTNKNRILGIEVH